MVQRTIILIAWILALGLVCSPAQAQANPDPQPIFTHVALWGVPRAQWGDMAKVDADNKVILDRLVADGTLIGYGNFENRIHSEEGYTHGGWFQATSLGNLFRALEMFYNRPTVTAPALGASRHIDHVMVADIHGARAVTDSTGYLRVISAQIRPGMRDDFEAAYRRYILPVYEKLLADGTLISYQLDTEYNIQNAPGRFFSAVVLRDADGLDKLRMAIGEVFSRNPAALGALVSATVPNSRNDVLGRVTSVTRK